jgi:hypothetical protein
MINIKIVLLLLAILIAAFPFNAFGDGACCAPNGNCTIQYNNGDCVEGGGTFLGDDTVCNPNPCQQEPSSTIPTLNEWGMIIFTMLAGLGAVYYLRRQKTAKS